MDLSEFLYVRVERGRYFLGEGRVSLSDEDEPIEIRLILSFLFIILTSEPEYHEGHDEYGGSVLCERWYSREIHWILEVRE